MIFSEEEKTKFKKRFDEGLSWHGCKPHEAFKRCGMSDEYEEYNRACEFLHVRDYPFPAGLLPNNERDIIIQFEFNNTLSRIESHLEDFVQFCPNTFSNEVEGKLKEIKKRIFDLTNKLAIKIDPEGEMRQFIGIYDWDYE